MAFGRKSTALVDRAHTIAFDEGGILTIETPSRRDYWFGHGYRIEGPLDRVRFDRLRAVGIRRFGAIPGVRRFTIVSEIDGDVGAPAPDFGDESVETSDVLVFSSPRIEMLDPAIVPVLGDDRWHDIGAVAAAQWDPEQADFQRWALRNHRDAVRAGRAAFFGAVVSDRVVAYAGAYYGEGLARFVTPNTLERYRGRGLFAKCARYCLAEAARRQIHSVVIVAESGSYQRRIYGRLGARIVGKEHAIVVDPHVGETPRL